MRKCLDCKFLVKRRTRSSSAREYDVYNCDLLPYSIDKVQAHDEVDCWRYRRKKKGGDE